MKVVLVLGRDVDGHGLAHQMLGRHIQQRGRGTIGLTDRAMLVGDEKGIGGGLE